VAVGLGVGLAYGLKEVIPSMIKGSTQVESTLKLGQRVKFDGHVGTILQAGAFHIVMQNEVGKTIVIPTKSITDKEYEIESESPHLQHEAHDKNGSTKKIPKVFRSN
jgi:Mechanosensitive ion channel